MIYKGPGLRKVGIKTTTKNIYVHIVISTLPVFPRQPPTSQQHEAVGSPAPTEKDEDDPIALRLDQREEEATARADCSD